MLSNRRKTQTPSVADFNSFIDTVFVLHAHLGLVDERNAIENLKTSLDVETSSNASNADAPLSDNGAAILYGRDKHASNSKPKEINGD